MKRLVVCCDRTWNTTEKLDPWTAKGPGQKVEQVWFPGAHSDIGSGLAEYRLSNAALLWMAGRASNVGARRSSGSARRSHWSAATGPWWANVGVMNGLGYYSAGHGRHENREVILKKILTFTLACAALL